MRSVPRASAGLSRLAASPVPAAPPAPISVCASSMNRMIGFGRRLHLVDHLAQPFSNSPFMLAPACSRPMSSVSSDTSLQLRRHVAAREPQREAFDHRGLADARLAGEDRIVLAAAHQDVDDLADLLVAAGDRIDLALARLLGQVDRELLERLLLAHRGRRHRAARFAGLAAPTPLPSLRALALLGRAADDAARSRRSASSTLMLLELLARSPSSALRRRGVFSMPTHQVAGAHLRVAEHQRAVDPAALDRVLDVLGEVGDRGRAARQAVERGGDVARQRAPGRARSAGRCGAGRSPGVCRICVSQCTSSTYGLPRSLQNTVAPSIAL